MYPIRCSLLTQVSEMVHRITHTVTSALPLFIIYVYVITYLFIVIIFTTQVAKI